MRRLAKVLGTVSLVAWFGAAQGPLRADAASDVKAVDSNVYDAIAARDAARLGDVLDDGFLLTNTFGDVYDKEKFLSACCSGAATSKTLLLGATESLVKTFGSAAVIVARTEMRFTKDNQEQKLTWRSTRMYVKSGTKWKLVAEQRTSF